MNPTSIVHAPSSFLDTAWKGAAAVAAPMLGGMLMDLADLFSLGPQAVPLAILVAAPLGWGIAAALGLSRTWRLGSALVAGIYCLLPGMELIPAATATSLLGVLSSRLAK
jgi:hypothetical protein